MKNRIYISTILLFVCHFALGQVFISELFTASNGNTILRNEKYIEIYNPQACAFSLSGWELQIISNCTSILSFDLSPFTIGGNSAMRFSSSNATLLQTANIPGFDFANIPGNINLEWNGQLRDGARLLDNNGTVVDLAVPSNLMDCGSNAGLYQNARLVRQDNICQGNTTFNFGEWMIINIVNIGNLPATIDHVVNCTVSGGTPGLWTGIQDNNWHNCANWDDFNIPTATVDVVIPHTAPNFCEISSANAVCNNLTITGSGLGDISLQIRNGNELDVFGETSIFRDGGDGFCALILDDGILDIAGDFNVTLNSPITTSSVFIDMTSNSPNLITCADLTSQNLSGVFNTIDFNMGFNAGNIECDSFEMIGSGIAGSNDFRADFGPLGSTLEIDEDLTLSDNARLDFRSGNVNIAGHLYDNNLFASGIVYGLTNSTYQFKGNTDQTINSLHTIRFRNMSLLNVLGASVILNTDIEINGVLNLGNDYIQLNENTIFIEESDPSALFGTGGIVCESLNFDGRIDWFIGDTPNQYTFPFAATVGGTVIPFVFDMTSGETDRVEVSTYGTGWQNQPFPPGIMSLDNASSPGNPWSVVDRWWLIEAPDEGGLLADITFTYLDSEEHLAGCVTCTNAKRHTGTIWEPGFQDPTPIYNDIPGLLHQVTINNISTFSPWGISTVSEPLPVGLSAFEVSKENQESHLTWTSISEINSFEFQIERAGNNQIFNKIGTVKAAGNSNGLIEYSFIDEEPFNGQNYYRLKQIDFDGSFEYSEIRSLYFEQCAQLTRVESGYLIQCTSPQNYILFDARGKKIQNGFSNNIRLSEFSSGIYILLVGEEKFKLHF